MTRRFPLVLVLVLVLALDAAGCGGQTGTIGAVLAQRPDGSLVVREVPSGLAADKAGLKPGDEIMLIEGVDVRMMEEKAVFEALNGDVGSKVKLTVVRGEEVMHVTVQRTAARKYKPKQ